MQEEKLKFIFLKYKQFTRQIYHTVQSCNACLMLRFQLLHIQKQIANLVQLKTSNNCK
jgi:hypothetical protein